MSFNWPDYILLLVVLISLITDIKSRKILNIVTYPAMLIGLAANMYILGPLPGAVFSIKGLILGILIFWIPFAMGGLGAGDLKLLGVIGSFKGLTFTLWTGLYTALAGGVISLLIIIFDKQKRQKTIGFIKKYLFARTHSLEFEHDKERSQYYFPYSTAIVLGMSATYLLI